MFLLLVMEANDQQGQGVEGIDHAVIVTEQTVIFGRERRFDLPCQDVLLVSRPERRHHLFKVMG